MKPNKPYAAATPPLKFLLEASDSAVGNFELAKLGEVADLRREMLTLFDRIVDVSAQTVLAAYLRTVDRNELRRQLTESPDTTIEVIMAEAQAQIRSQGRSPEELGDGPMPSNWGIFRPKLPPEEAHRRRLESNKRLAERHIAAGKCRKCSKPLCRESVEYCTKHLAKRREAQRRRKGTVHTHRRHPNTLAALRKANERRKKT